MAKQKKDSNISPSFAPSRPPVVVVLGHVDHGKTTLLDAIRKTDVATKEYGGITQSIGAYQIAIEGARGERPAARKITFIDTPGHEAFSKMRSRGVSAADIAVLVVAANDSVMPQTVESIKIIKEAKIPYIVAINKIDLPEANVDKVISDLGRHEVQLEKYGGEVPWVKVSAKKVEGISELLDLITLVGDVAGISGTTDGPLEAIVIESKLDNRRGPLATVIVKNGTLKLAERVYIEGEESKVRALIDFTGRQTQEALPGDPVEILGLSKVPPIGASISCLQGQTLQTLPGQSVLNRSDQVGGQSLSLILKADTLGSLEAITAKVPTNVNLIQSSVGEITEADILLAKSTKAIILGFNVRESTQAQKLAGEEKVLVRTYKIIYELLDELTDAAAGMLEPIEKEEVLGVGKIIAEFPFEKMRISGVKVSDGRLAKGDRLRVTRAEETVGESKIKSVRVGKEELNKVEAGKECGLLLEPQVDFRVGDGIISYRLV